jgi:hypothetical protein
VRQVKQKDDGAGATSEYCANAIEDDEKVNEDEEDKGEEDMGEMWHSDHGQYGAEASLISHSDFFLAALDPKQNIAQCTWGWGEWATYLLCTHLTRR